MPNYTYKVIDTEGGKGFIIYRDGKPYIHQVHLPTVQGFQKMNSTKAKEEAEKMIKYLENLPKPEEFDEFGG